MKRLTSVILCSALSLTAAFYAGAADIAEDFEGMTANARPVGCEVIEKTGSSVLVLSQGNNKFVRISAVKPDEANLGDAYINYNDNSLENQASYELSLTPRDTVGTKAFMFRDASANFLSLARFSNGVLTLLPDFASGSSWASSYSVGILCRLRFVINVKTRTVTVYKDGTKLKTVENADVKSAVFSRFDFSKFTARVQNQSLENAGEASVMDVDNIRFTKEYGIKQNMSVTSLDFTKNINNKTYSVENTVAGNISGNAVIENNTSAPVKIAAVLAHFNSGVLTGAAYRAETVNAGQREKITALYNSPDSEGEMRLFFWNADTLEPLTGGNAKLEKGKYKTPFVDEILNDFTAYGATSHPRLFGNAADFEAAKLKYPGDENLSRAYANLISKANALLPKPVTVYSLNSLNQLLSVSREALDRAQILGMAYKLSNAPDKIKYAERLADELIAVSRFPDWNPQHFLDTSEMTVAAAIGYDWIYDALDASQKTEIKQAIITKGLTPGKLAYDGQLGSWGNWVSWDWNWNVVCNGGLAVGALAVMDDDPDLAAEIIQNGLKSYRVMVGEFAPDGAWKEGPGYWAYTAKYLTFYMAVLESALGTSYGYFDAEGVAGTCYYAIYMSGGKKSYNLNDSGDGLVITPEFYWFAKRTNDPAVAGIRYNAQMANRTGYSPMDLLWLDPGNADLNVNLPLSRMFRDSEVATYRSGWGANDSFAGLHGGFNNVPHGNLDAGDFVLDSQGERFALELGGDDYGLPGYFDNANGRWNYYRNRAEGQNVIVINPLSPGMYPGQRLNSVSLITGYDAEHATVDMTPAYEGQASAASRELKAYNGNTVFALKDDLTLTQSSEAYWFMHTAAQITVAEDGKSAVLTQNGKRLWAGLYTNNPDAVFSIMDARALPGTPDPSGQQSHAGDADKRKLTVHVTNVSEIHWTVLFAPLSPGETVPGSLPDL